MSQQPGHPEENGHYGYDRGNPGYGQQTYAPQGYEQRRGGYDQGEPEGYGQQPGYPQQGYGQQPGGHGAQQGPAFHAAARAGCRTSGRSSIARCSAPASRPRPMAISQTRS